MKKPWEIYLFGGLYLLFGVLIIIGYLYLVITDWAIFTFSSYDAGDVVYSGAAAEFIGKFILGPVIFVGAIIALIAAIFILSDKAEFKKKGYYLMIIASVFWTLPIIGLITIIVFLGEDVKKFLLG